MYEVAPFAWEWEGVCTILLYLITASVPKNDLYPMIHVTGASLYENVAYHLPILAWIV